MSLTWKYTFLGAGQAPEENGMMIAERIMPEDGARKAIKCLRCTCDTGNTWYLAGLCACGKCAPFDGYNQLGDPQTFPGSGDPVELTNGQQVRAVQIVAHDPEAGANQLVALVQAWGTRDGLKGQYLTAIKHVVASPPLTGTATASLIIDGVAVALGGETVTACTEGVSVTLGWNAFGTDPDAKVALLKLAAPYAFTTGGNHAVDLRIEFAGGGEVVKTTQRIALTIYDLGSPIVQLSSDPPGPGDVYVLPFDPDGDSINECSIVNGDMTMSFVHFYGVTNGFLGPYDTRADAEFIVEEFSEMIAAMMKCTCPKCSFGGAGNIQFATDDETPAGTYDYYGSGVDQQGPASCDDSWVVWEYGCMSDPGIWALVYINGSLVVIENGDSGTLYIPPCADVSVKVHYDGFDNKLFTCLANPFGSVNPPTPCPFEDPTDPLYGVPIAYNASTNAGIPANATDLADYRDVP